MKKLVIKLWSSQFFRFLVVGGFNVVFGYGLTIILLKLLQNFGFNQNIVCFGLVIDIPILASTLIGIPLAYTTQTLVAFREKWKLTRMLYYPITMIPNVLIQQITYFYMERLINQLSPLAYSTYISYAIATIAPIPVMFIMVKFIVTNKKKIIHTG
ncbi:hypothetical protein QJ48_13530 [Paenibacillus sp. A3]|uniref:hypothetical protein n=1 Tax=Paenibacillus sp. A3 TaxID=1337054 RepID=UPI0006D56400|nr:hypothetical protein [Paenibacillus sp. A3]KPV58969.1 hypothetical protein QJ48_13530 [Paenibacillus sp. A3]